MNRHYKEMTTFSFTSLTVFAMLVSHNTGNPIAAVVSVMALQTINEAVATPYQRVLQWGRQKMKMKNRYLPLD